MFFYANILLKKCQPLSVLYDFAQIVLESPVPQDSTKGSRNKSGNSKDQVNFDMTIWKEPNKTCFDLVSGEPLHYPLAILEWKAKSTWGTGTGSRTTYKKDKDKLSAYTADKSDKELIAIALWLNHDRRDSTTPYLLYSIFYKGTIFENKEDIMIL